MAQFGSGTHPEVGAIRPHIAAMIATAVPHNYKCPKLDCRAEYFAIHRDYAPDEKPRCSECATPFLVMEKGQYIHYLTPG